MGVLNPGTNRGTSKFRSLAAVTDPAAEDQRLDDAIVVIPLFKLLSMLSDAPPDSEAMQWRDQIGEVLAGAGFTDDQINQRINTPPADPDTVEMLGNDQPLEWKGLTIGIGVKRPE